MYPCYQKNIVGGRESFPFSWIVGENLLYIALWGISGYLLWPIWIVAGLPVLTIIWAILVVVVQILLKKHNCSGCYYYDKWCHLGWGKMASTLFEQDSGDPKLGMKLAFFYILPPPLILIAAIAAGLLKDVSGLYWFMTGVFVVLNGLTFPIRKTGCGQCAMRKGCPGSAVKT